FIIFLFLGYHVVAYAEMGRDREFCYPGSPENNTTPAVFYYNFGTTIISDINNNIPGTILPEKNWKIGLYKAYCNSISNYEVYFSGVSGIDPSGTSGIQQGSDIFVPVTHE
ncbi:TPA: fimbrial protein, partial [Escherichia coli]|nr:fimbrial protein [Escherichia coli]